MDNYKLQLEIRDELENASLKEINKYLFLARLIKLVTTQITIYILLSIIPICVAIFVYHRTGKLIIFAHSIAITTIIFFILIERQSMKKDMKEFHAESKIVIKTILAIKKGKLNNK